MARLAGARLTLRREAPEAPGEPPDDCATLPIECNGQQLGSLFYPPSGLVSEAEECLGAMRALLEYAAHRELAVSDFADQLLVNYEELNMLYNLLPAIASKIDERDIGQILVHEAAVMLDCSRVSLLVLDEDNAHLRVLASVGLPKEAQAVRIPVHDSVAGRVLTEGKPFSIEDICQRPDLAELSVGTYETTTFAVIRVPMRARGEPIGVLAATERQGGGEFTARDFKLLEGLSSMGAASLMHCRLHTTTRRQMIGTIRALAAAVDAKDRYTHDHSSRVSRLCLAMGGMMGIDDAEMLREIELAGLLHDIGKIGVPDTILLKADRLTNEEYEVVKTHARIGASIASQVKGLQRVTEAILHHHERWDGRGYPQGLAGKDIPQMARMIAVADTYDSITSDRAYRKGTDNATALQEIHAHAGSQFDPEVVAALQVAFDDPGVALLDALEQ